MMLNLGVGVRSESVGRGLGDEDRAREPTTKEQLASVRHLGKMMVSIKKHNLTI